MQILHISADYPDPLRPGKTRAVANLLDLAREHDHAVYSLNRVGWRLGVSALPFDHDHKAIAYGAPPFSVALRRFLKPVADWIIRDAKQRQLSPAIVHAHKLVVEGLVGEAVAKALGARLIVSSQGNTDLKFIAARPSLRPVWARVWQSAEVVLPFAPWTEKALSAALGQRDGPVMSLPCPTPSDRMIEPRRTKPVVRTVFGLDDAENKNVQTLIQAVTSAAERVPDIRLEIIGRGNPESYSHLARMIGSNRLVRMLGPLPSGQVQGMLNKAVCMALPSRRESYGMVFAEALLAGCPVVHGAGCGIAGYFPDAPFAVPAAQDDASALAAVLVRMIDDQVAVKQSLHRAQRRGAFDILRRPAIAATYREALAIAAPATAKPPMPELV